MMFRDEVLLSKKVQIACGRLPALHMYMYKKINSKRDNKHLQKVNMDFGTQYSLPYPIMILYDFL